MRELLDTAKELMRTHRALTPVMWPETLSHLMSMDRRHHWDPETLEEESLLVREKSFADPERLMELLQSSEAGLIQLATLAQQWEKRQANAVRLLRQQLDTLNVQRIEAERKHRQILEEQWSPRLNNSTFTTKREDGGDSASPMDEDETSSSGGSGSRGSLVGSVSGSFGDEQDGSLEYWKERARTLDRLLAESLQREQALLSRLHENLVEPTASLPLEELQDHLHRLDNFLHFTLRKAPIVVGHQDKELRYRFVYNAFPSLSEEEVMGKTDAEIYSGVGVEELSKFKREVLQRGFPAKREIHFDTDLFGSKTFLVAVEPVFSKTGDILGLNYVAMDVTDEAAKREKLMCWREENAVQKAMETELHKTIDITEETMRAKQMLATMSHEIRSPLSGVVSIAEVLYTTKLDTEQRQLVEVMMSSGDLVLQLINDILDLSKVESGAMKLESKKFRPREVVKHVLQMTLASVQQKHLVLEGNVGDDVPLEVIGDVLRIRQVFTNLVSNAIKFTHKGVVSIKMRLESSPDSPLSTASYAKLQTNKTCKAVNNVDPSHSDSSSHSQMINNEQASPPRSLARNLSEVENQGEPKDGSDSSLISRSTSTSSSVSTLSSASSTASSLSSVSSFTAKSLDEVSGVEETAETSPPATRAMWESSKAYKADDIIWLHCEVCDTGIGIPEAALPSLFEKYTQVSTTHARKYGGTGLGLAICKQLVGLMGGTLKVASKENEGSTFSFTLPLKAVKEKPSQVQLNDKVYKMMSDAQGKADMSTKKRGYFQFTPNVISSSAGSTRPLVHSPSADGKGKNGKASDVSKLRQMYGESFANCSQQGDSYQSGETNSTADKVLPGEEHKSLSSSRDVTGSSSSQPCCDVSSDLKHKRGATSDTTSQSPSASMKPNTTKNNSSGSKLSVPPLPPARILNPGPNAEQRTHRLPKILLAEDNKVNVMVAQSMLKRLGHSLEVVSNGAEAVHAYQKSNYDLILMDVSMPVMDGLEATRLIRKFEETGQWLYSEEKGEAERSGSSSSSTNKSVSEHAQKSETAGMLLSSPRQRTPIIAMTANALADNVVECYSHGMDSFIAKPVTFQKLEQVLKEFIPQLDHPRGAVC